MRSIASRLSSGEHLTLTHAPEGFDALALADIARGLSAGKHKDAASIVHISREGGRMDAMQRALAFFAPEIDVLVFPAWDCQPYDRVSPNPAVTAARMTVLARLARTTQGDRPRIVLSTVNAVLQRVTSRAVMAQQSLSMAPGNALNMKHLSEWMEHNGFSRTSTVRDTGEYAVRGGIVDLFAPGTAEPVRLDFFGDTLESIRAFDPESQRTTGQMRALDLVPASELLLTGDTIRAFRQNYVSTFGAPGPKDSLYSTISEGRRYPGAEHWLPLFHVQMETLFDYIPHAPVMLDALADSAVKERFDDIGDHYTARQEVSSGYKPLPPSLLYLKPDEFETHVKSHGLARISGFTAAGTPKGDVIDLGAREGRNFLAERSDPNANVFDAAVSHLKNLQEKGKRIIVAAWSEGARDRLGVVLTDHGLKNTKLAPSFDDVHKLPKSAVALVVLGLEAGVETDSFAIVAEQDILGDRLVRQRKKSTRAHNFLTEITGLSAGDIVVHVDHGIGQFVGLKTIDVTGSPHDCVELVYAGGDKLFLPVENIELLTRYGSEDVAATLDRLGGAGWQSRKAKLKKRIREMAGELINIAAARMLREAPRLTLPDGLYDEFCARFSYDETEDQQTAIDAVLDDLAAGRPMDRLVCGDVGFGKTEVALRAAFATVMGGKQVAIVVPTTLLARQHYKTFVERFQGLPVRVAQASRFVPAAELKKNKEDLSTGNVDIIVGTHALLGKAISFKDLGLVVVDEEQHFGVSHKEKLKQLRAEVHMLTLSATPIPRTLQLALTGVRELSIIATPPVDRMVVRTFVSPFDPLIVREALLRERYRGGQSFYVCPRIEHIAEAREFLAKHVPEVKVAVAHGQMAARELEDVMTAFYEGEYDVLLATAIVESGLDIPRANTLVVHRADMFGLAALYQLRGRVGRSKLRAYALFTVPDNKTLTANAERRLKVLQSLDTLGAGFQLASHDLDIRGAGNLLGDEQSGHIREVGYELYQHMLEEAITNQKDGISAETQEQWSPQIQMGTPVLIPETYVEDLHLRLGLYRRLAELETDDAIHSFAAEMTDRFGPPPEEVEHLLQVMTIKALCRRANVDKIDAGPKGMSLSFRENTFSNPDALVGWLARDAGDAKLRPDMKVVFKREWPTPLARLKGTANILRQLVKLADVKKAA
jgi:transcription-repair coupling factor (superfamily II helicase)